MYNPRAKPGARVTNSAESKVVVHGSMGGHDVILTLISKLWRTMISNRFNRPTRLFCFCQNHDTTLTVILKFAK